MGNEAFSPRSIGQPRQVFHSTGKQDRGATIQLEQSQTPKAKSPTPKITRPNRALSGPIFSNESKSNPVKRKLRPLPQPDAFEFTTSVTSGKQKLNEQLLKAMDATPFSNIMEDISDAFIYKRRLAKGSCCCVLLCVHKENKKLYALKEMDRVSIWNPKLYMTEKKVLQMLQDHPNVMTYFDSYIDDQCLYIASEYCSGGTLLDRIIKLKVFTEEIAAKYISTILKVVDYMHQKNVCHRDLKLNNIVFDKNGDDGILKVIDFGDALIIDDNDEDKTFAGTPNYLPPELLRRKRRKGWEIKKGDVYCVGVIAYVLLTGCFPFQGKNKEKIKEAILDGSITWPPHVKLSHDCKDFILSLLDQNIEKRPSAKQALSHKWLANASKDDLGDDLKLYQTNFHHSNKLQQILIQAIFSEMSKDEKKFVIDELKKHKTKRKVEDIEDNDDGNESAVITKDASMLCENEFVEFMIANHVDEKKAEFSTRSLFKRISYSQSDVILKKDTLEFLNGFEIDHLIDDIGNDLISTDRQPKLSRKQPKLLSAIVEEEEGYKSNNGSLMITKGKNDKVAIEIMDVQQMPVHDPNMNRNRSESVSVFKTEVDLNDSKLTITVKQFKDLLAKAPKINNECIDTVIKDLDPNKTGLIDLKKITNYTREIEMYVD